VTRRYRAPCRGDTSAGTFAHPAFSGFERWRDWCLTPEWPDIDALNAGLAGATHAFTGRRLRFVVQTPELLADGHHYESRIFERGEIATRTGNWHDLLNAMIWCRFPAIKSALNLRQFRDVQAVGSKQRTPAQYAQTLFDEGGAIVHLRDDALRSAWDAHDWRQIFRPGHWHAGAIGIHVFGHALLEHALTPDKLMTAKCLVWLGDSPGFDVVASTAAAIADGRWLNDPQELRPLPVSGIPGWYARQDEAFYRDGACFRPLRAGRIYPRPTPAATALPCCVVVPGTHGPERSSTPSSG
jgi:hypothetical protein